jgi:hypothetical protein
MAASVGRTAADPLAALGRADEAAAVHKRHDLEDKQLPAA